jgi:DNA-binding XRE family transcriptional regulator
MRDSPLRHTLAVLRTTIGYTQKEMAELCGCSVPTIQAVELGKLKLSGKLAGTVVVQTGVSETWLWDDNVSSPILDSDWQPYTKEYFESFRARRLTAGGREEDYKLAAYTLAIQVARIAGSLVEAHRIDDLRLLCYRLDREILLITRDLLDKNKHFDSWVSELHDDNATKTLQTTKQTDDAVMKKILQDFWTVLDSQFQKKKDRALTVPPKTVATKPVVRKTPKTI